MSKRTQFKGRRVIIFGATSVLGKSLSLYLASSGANLILTGRNDNALNKLTAKCRAIGVECDYFLLDFKDQSQIQEMAKNTIQLYRDTCSIFFLNAFNVHGPTTAVPFDNIMHLLNVNCLSQIFAIRQFWRHLISKERAHIVLFCSGTAHFAPPMETYYSMSKAMLARFAEGLQFEAIGTNVRVSVVYPKPFDSPTFNPSLVFGDVSVKKRTITPINVEDLASKIIDGVTEGKKEIHLSLRPRIVALASIFFKKALFFSLKKSANTETTVSK